MKYEINNHIFEIKADYSFYHITWTSYMDIKFTVRIEPNTKFEELNTGFTHFMELTRNNGKTWEYVCGMEDITEEKILNDIQNLCFRFTRTY